MKSNRSVRGSGRCWVVPTVTKLAIGTQTKSPVVVNHRLASESSGGNSVIEPSPKVSAVKFGFSFEWSFPLSVRTD